MLPVVAYFLLVLVAIAVFIRLRMKPDYYYWLFLMLFFDPGGFFTGYREGNIAGSIKYYDVFFFLMMMVFIFSPGKKLPFRDKTFRVFFAYLIIVYILYYLIVYGAILPVVNGQLDYLFFLRKNRIALMLPFVVYSFYYFSWKSYEIFFRFIVYFSFVILSLWMITLFSPLKIVPVMSMLRYEESSMERLFMASYGLIDVIYMIGIYLFLVKRKYPLAIKNTALIYVSAILMIITLMLTLTRREYLRMVVSVVIAMLVTSYTLKMSYLKHLVRGVFSLLFLLLALNILFPVYSRYAEYVIKDAFSLVMTGKDLQGREDYRISGEEDMVYVKRIIKDHFLLGTGYIPVQWSDIVEMKMKGDERGVAYDAAAEVAVYNGLMRFGIVGVLLFLPFYVMFLKQAFLMLKEMKRNALSLLKKPVMMLLIFLCIHLLFMRFSTEIYTVFGEMAISFYTYRLFLFFTLLLVLKNKIKEEQTKENTQLYPLT